MYLLELSGCDKISTLKCVEQNSKNIDMGNKVYFNIDFSKFVCFYE